MQDMNKVNQMFDKMFLGAGAGASNNHAAKRKPSGMSAATLSTFDLSGATVGQSGFKASSGQSKPQVTN